MRNLIFNFLFSFTSIFLCAFNSSAHEYYFAFAEMEYNAIAGQLEGTLIVSTHDLDFELKDKKLINKELALLEPSDSLLTILQQEFSAHFILKESGQQINWKLEGYDILLNGLTNFYFSAKMSQPPQQLAVRFDLLMDKFPLQQNKLTYTANGTKNTFVFLTEMREQLITNTKE